MSRPDLNIARYKCNQIICPDGICNAYNHSKNNHHNQYYDINDNADGKRGRRKHFLCGWAENTQQIRSILIKTQKEKYEMQKLKVSHFQNVFLVSSILPKNKRKELDLRYHSSEVEIFDWFLGELKIPKRHFEIKVQRAELVCEVIK